VTQQNAERRGRSAQPSGMASVSNPAADAEVKSFTGGLEVLAVSNRPQDAPYRHVVLKTRMGRAALNRAQYNRNDPRNLSSQFASIRAIGGNFLRGFDFITVRPLPHVNKAQSAAVESTRTVSSTDEPSCENSQTLVGLRLANGTRHRPLDSWTRSRRTTSKRLYFLPTRRYFSSL
jgi:hypothetical protein